MMSFFPVSQFLLSRQHRLVEREIKTSLPEESSLDHRGLTVSGPLISAKGDRLNMLVYESTFCHNYAISVVQTIMK